MTTLTLASAVEAIGASKDDGWAKNMFALGLLSWMYGRPDRGQRDLHPGEVRPQARCRRGQRAGAEGGLELRRDHRGVRHHLRGRAGQARPGEYRQISGNTALAYGIIAAGQLAGIQVVLGSYPITPASDILHELSRHKNFNVLTFQAEDEIAGIGAAIGASYGVRSA